MLIKLKQMIDEENYPYFTEEYLQTRLQEISTKTALDALALELLIIKSGIGEFKLGDITIKSPSSYFLMLANDLRNKIRAEGARNKVSVSGSRTLLRADGRK